MEIEIDSIESTYLAGDKIVVSPTVQVHRGDRVVAKTHAGDEMAKVLGRQNQSKVELLSLNPEHAPREFKLADVAWIARIMWVSQ